MTTTERGAGVPAGVSGVTSPGDTAVQAAPHPQAAPPLTEDGFSIRARAGRQQSLPQVFTGRMDQVLTPEAEPAPDVPAGIQYPRSPFAAAPDAGAAE